MNDSQSTDAMVNAVVDNLADKLGIAVEKLQPIAETAIAETSRLGMANCCLGVVCFILLISATTIFLKYMKGKDADDNVVAVVVWVFSSVLLSIFGLLSIADGLAQWLAPTMHVIDRVLG